jgi:hypothetical protein
VLKAASDHLCHQLIVPRLDQYRLVVQPEATEPLARLDVTNHRVRLRMLSNKVLHAQRRYRNA